MKKQLIAIAGLTFFLVAALICKSIVFKSLGYTGIRLYWMSVALCAIIVVILCANQLVEGRRHRVKPQKKRARISDPNRRKSYRVTYPSDLRPILIVDKLDNAKKRTLEYPVVDISEEGIRFINDGSLGKATEVAGKIQFHNGETQLIVCTVIRQDSRYICAELKYNIAWSTILNEQRRMMALQER